MTYPIWEPRHRVTTIAPGKIDLFVLTLIDGRRAGVDPITDYDAAVAKARAFHRDHPRCNIKVLPLSGPECRNLFDIEPGEQSGALDPEMRKQMVGRLVQIARDSSDSDARQDSFALLQQMGAINQ